MLYPLQTEGESFFLSSAPKASNQNEQSEIKVEQVQDLYLIYLYTML